MTPRSLGCWVALLAILAAVPANALVVCAKKSGRLLTREACKKREMAATQFDTAAPVATLTELGIVPPLRAVAQ